ncbi:hypothetical protein [Actinomadura rugatobispora]|uniref:Uncharacterized protein n=1 Tax=Actinomadura rugatobispora TaxID=1994 RepID=A0ABW1AB22_9ACTN|nr:hypothetical protein GCM10010200_060880 [Actinomadura rugatobispora]
MSDDEKRKRVRDIEQTLNTLRGELGEPSDDPRDYGDAGQDLVQREEHAAQIEALETERDRLLEELND